MIDLDYKAIGMRIRVRRKEKGWSQAHLAELSSMEPSNISHIERGTTKLSLKSLVNLANALSCTSDDLLCDNLPKSYIPYLEEASALLSDCTHEETRIITKTMRSLKCSLRGS